MKLFAHNSGKDYEIHAEPDQKSLTIKIGRKKYQVTLDEQTGRIRTAFLDHQRVEFGWTRTEEGYRILIDGIEYDIILRDPRSELLAQSGASSRKGGKAEVKAPIPGRITRRLLSEGDEVKQDQPVLCLDAMKLENEIPSPQKGTVAKILVTEGQAVEKGEVLFIIQGG
ncbi:MAG: biotin/lipoyl-containing protein [Planctomycetota bacterium]|jgi:biotin carboxyl carrier protein|nr:biotin/lipoyl-containing protein [Planctomycetota bacterium]